MSRTYRRKAVPLDCNCGAPIGPNWKWRIWGHTPTSQEIHLEIKISQSKGIPPRRCCYCSTNQKYDYYTTRNYKRDKKEYSLGGRLKAPSYFKKIRQKIRRAKVNDAMRNKKYEQIPYFRKENDWLYWGLYW